jgi:hypothetical protein
LQAEGQVEKQSHLELAVVAVELVVILLVLCHFQTMGFRLLLVLVGQ